MSLEEFLYVLFLSFSLQFVYQPFGLVFCVFVLFVLDAASVAILIVIQSFVFLSVISGCCLAISTSAINCLEILVSK